MDSTNQVVLVCRLTRDPELKSLPGGSSVCSMRVAFNTSRKDGDEWKDKSNYIDVTVWGKQGETCARHLEKGRQVAVSGRLEWREYENKDGNKVQVIDITANRVEFLGGGGGESGGGAAPQSDVPADTSGFARQPAPVGPGNQDDDIPF